MKRNSSHAIQVPFLKRPDDPASLPVLTDELVPARTRSGRTLWLAWDEKRVPLLDEVVDVPADAARTVSPATVAAEGGEGDGPGDRDD